MENPRKMEVLDLIVYPTVRTVHDLANGKVDYKPSELSTTLVGRAWIKDMRGNLDTNHTPKGLEIGVSAWAWGLDVIKRDTGSCQAATYKPIWLLRKAHNKVGASIGACELRTRSLGNGSTGWGLWHMPPPGVNAQDVLNDQEDLLVYALYALYRRPVALDGFYTVTQTHITTKTYYMSVRKGNEITVYKSTTGRKTPTRAVTFVIQDKVM